MPIRALPDGRAETTALVAVCAVLALGATVGVAWAAGFDAVLRRLLHPDPAWLVVAVGAEALAYAGYALAYREVARVDRGPELPHRGAAVLVAAGFAPFLPLGGFHLDHRALRLAGLAERDARVRVLGLGALEYAVLAPAACLAAIALLASGSRVHGGLTWPWAIAVPAGFAAAFALLRRRERMRPAVVRDVLEAVEVLRRLLVQPLDHGINAVAGAAVYWFGDLVALWACLHAFLGGAPPVTALIVGYATGYALTRRTLPLGGAGAVEALLPFALLWVGLPLAAAVVSVFAYRVVNLWLPLVPALAAFPRVWQLTERMQR